MRFLQVFHEDGNDNVHQHKLCHEDKDDEEDRSDDAGYAAVFNTVGRRIAVFTQSIFHDSVPVITSGHTEECEESDSKVSKMGVFTQALARMIVVAL